MCDRHGVVDRLMLSQRPGQSVLRAAYQTAALGPERVDTPVPRLGFPIHCR